MLLIYITWTKLDSKDALRGFRQSTQLLLSDILLCGGMILCKDVSEMLATHACLTPLTGTLYFVYVLPAAKPRDYLTDSRD